MRFDANPYYHLLEPYSMEKLTDEWREEAKFYEEAGFTTLWLAEHHFWWDQAGRTAPNPILFGSASKRAYKSSSHRTVRRLPAGLAPYSSSRGHRHA